MIIYKQLKNGEQLGSNLKLTWTCDKCNGVDWGTENLSVYA